MSLLETGIQRSGCRTDYSRGRDRRRRNAGRGAVTNWTRVLVKGHWRIWEELTLGERACRVRCREQKSPIYLKSHE